MSIITVGVPTASQNFPENSKTMMNKNFTVGHVGHAIVLRTALVYYEIKLEQIFEVIAAVFVVDCSPHLIGIFELMIITH